MGRLFQPVITVPLSCDRIIQPSQLQNLVDEMVGLRSKSVPEDGMGLTLMEPQTVCRWELRPWMHVFDMGCFKPEEIKVKVTDSTISVHARREVTDGDNFDLIERKRSVNIPECVDARKVVCFLNRAGKFIIQAPFSFKNRCGGEQFDSETDPSRQKETKLERKNHAGENKCCSPVQQTGCCNKMIESTNQKNDDANTNKTAKSQNPAVVKAGTLSSEHQLDDCKRKIYPVVHIAEGDRQILVKEDDKPVTSSPDVPSNEQCSSRSNSPFPFAEFPRLDEKQEGEDKNNCCKTDFCKQYSEILEPLTDSAEFVDEDGQNIFQIKLNLKPFMGENVSVKYKNSELCIEASRKCEDSGVRRHQNVQRTYQIPKRAYGDRARAVMSEEGILTVKIPIRKEQSEENVEEM